MDEPTPRGDDIPSLLLTVDGVVASPSMFSDRQALWVNGTEIFHRDSDGAVDIRLTRAVIRRMRDRLSSDPRVRLRPSSSSDWIEVDVVTADDEALLEELVARAAEAHRPPPGVAPAGPPVGGELKRRRRFH